MAQVVMVPDGRFDLQDDGTGTRRPVAAITVDEASGAISFYTLNDGTGAAPTGNTLIDNGAVKTKRQP